MMTDMAVIRCPNCGNRVSDGSPYCPHCRYPILESIPLRKNRGRTEIRSRDRSLPLRYRLCLLAGILGMGLGPATRSKWLLVSGAVCFLIGSAAVVYYSFGTGVSESADDEED